jgi:hypothetical protein
MRGTDRGDVNLLQDKFRHAQLRRHPQPHADRRQPQRAEHAAQSASSGPASQRPPTRSTPSSGTPPGARRRKQRRPGPSRRRRSGKRRQCPGRPGPWPADTGPAAQRQRRRQYLVGHREPDRRRDHLHRSRHRFYEKLKAITDSTIYRDKLANKLSLSPITGNAADLKEKAREDFAAFAALYSLSPFVLQRGRSGGPRSRMPHCRGGL